MAVVAVRELYQSGKRDFVTSLENGEEGLRTFQVECDSSSDNEATVLASPSLPPALDLFPGSSVCELIRKRVTRPDISKLIWEVTMTYRSRTSQEDRERELNPDPLNRLLVVTGQSRTVMTPVRRCLRTPAYQEWSEAGPGAGFTMRIAANSAGDPLDPPIVVAMVEWEYHFAKNVTRMPSWVMADSYQNGVNDADQEFDYNGYTETIPKGCGKLGNIKPGPVQRENGVDFIRLEWDITLRKPRELVGSETTAPSPWFDERLDEGLRTRTTVGSDTIWKNVRDSSGQMIMLPTPFNGAGQPITTSGEAIAEDELYFYCYAPFGPLVDFSVLPWS